MYWQEQLRRTRCSNQKAPIALGLQAVEDAFERRMSERWSRTGPGSLELIAYPTMRGRYRNSGCERRHCQSNAALTENGARKKEAIFTSPPPLLARGASNSPNTPRLPAKAARSKAWQGVARSGQEVQEELGWCFKGLLGRRPRDGWFPKSWERLRNTLGSALPSPPQTLYLCQRHGERHACVSANTARHVSFTRQVFSDQHIPGA